MCIHYVSHRDRRRYTPPSGLVRPATSGIHSLYLTGRGVDIYDDMLCRQEDEALPVECEDRLDGCEVISYLHAYGLSHIHV